LPAPAPLPTLDQDWQALRALTPSGLGVGVQPAEWFERRWHHLPDGAVVVTTIGDESPAWASGLRPGDRLLGLSGIPFTEADEGVAWLRIGGPGERSPVEILRAGAHRVVELVSDGAPVTIRARVLPGRIAPRPSGLDCGDLPLPRLQTDRKMLLFFWSPAGHDSLDAARELILTSLRVGAVPLLIAREPSQVVRGFLDANRASLPAPMLCAARAAFDAYRAGAPSFFLVGGDRRVIERSDGYHPGQPIFPPGE
jgi:hypothetical protein